MVDTVDGAPDGRRSWLVAIVGALAMIFTFGTPLSYGVLLGPLSTAYGIDPVVISSVFSLMLFTFFIGAGAIGVLAARLPARGVILTCALATGAISPSLYVVETYVGVAVVFATLGLALGTVFVLLASVVPRWFEERRGTAMGLIFVGNGLGLFVLPPAWQYAIGAVGLQQGFLTIMGTTTLAFLLAASICKRPAWAEQSTATVGELLAWLARLSRTRSFQLLFVGMGLAFAWYQLLAAYAIDMFTHRGLTEGAASIAFGLIGGVSIISRIGSGVVADSIGARRAFLGSLGCSAAGMALFFAPQLPVIGLGIFLTGIGLGGAATLYIPVLMQTYGFEKDTAVIGIFNIAGGIAALAVPPIGVALVARTGGYAMTTGLTLVLILVSMWTVAAGSDGG